MMRRLLLFCVPLYVLGMAGSASAASKPGAPAAQSISGAVSQSFNADGSVQQGMLVGLKKDDSKSVVAFSGSDVKGLLGVVVPSSDAAITLTPTGTKQQQVLVNTSGRVNVLVSNQGGTVKSGDYLTMSAVDGVAMRAGDTQTSIVGKAAGGFSGSANVITSVDVTDTTGHKSSVAIGRVAMDFSVAKNPLYQQVSDNVPSFLTGIATGIANKPVSAARIYISLFVFLMTAIVTGNLLYSGVRSGMIAVGRNPLSKKSIMRSLIQTIIAGMIVFIGGVFAVYLLLKL